MDAIQKRILMEVAGLEQTPAGAYNIRTNGKSAARNVTANIDIVSKEDGSGIDIHIKPGTKKESVHIPVVLSVFDEPEAGIDLWSFKSLLEVFEHMRSANSDRTIIVISHQERILNIADEIIVLGGGRIMAQGTKEEILPTLLGTSSVASSCGQLTKGGNP